MSKPMYLRPEAVDYLEPFDVTGNAPVGVVLASGVRVTIAPAMAAELLVHLELASEVRAHRLQTAANGLAARRNAVQALAEELPALFTVLRALPSDTTAATMLATASDTLARVLGRLGVDVGGDPLGSMFEDFLRGPAELTPEPEPPAAAELTPEPEPPAAAELTPEPPAAPPPIKRQRRAAQETSAAAEAPRADEG